MPLIVTATLTGTPDATTDLSLSLSSVTLTLNNGSRSYVSAYLPGDAGKISAINLRPNGELVIDATLYADDGSIVSTDELYRGNFDSLDYTFSPDNYSLALKSTNTETNVAPASFTVEKHAVAGLNSNGERTFEFNEYHAMKAGDSVTVGGVTITTRSIRYTVSPKNLKTTITEQL